MSSLSRKPFARCWYAALGLTDQAVDPLKILILGILHCLDTFFLLIKMTFYVRVKYIWLKVTAAVSDINLMDLKSPKRQASRHTCEGLS